MDGRPNRRNKAALSNFLEVVRTGPYSSFNKFEILKNSSSLITGLIMDMTYCEFRY